MEGVATQQLSRQTFTCSKLTIKTLKQHKKNTKANLFTFLSVFIGSFEHNNMAKMAAIMVVAMTTYVNTTVIKTMIATPTIAKTKNNACNYG